MNIVIVLVLLVVNIPIYKRIFKLFFKSKEDFDESLRYVFTPDLFSLVKGEYGRDWYGELKIQILITMCGGAVFLEYLIIRFIVRLFSMMIS